MNYRTVSSQQIIGKVFRDFRPSETDWTAGDVLEWIGETVENIGHHTGFVKKSKTLEISDYRCKLPCDLESLHMVEYQGAPLACGSDRSGFGLVWEEKTNKTSKSSDLQFYTDIEGFTDLPNGITYNDDPYYLINPDYIQTSFRDGTVKLHYQGFNVDKDGFPLIPDEYNYREACTWNIIYHLLLRGMRHPTIQWDNALELTNQYIVKARNRAKTQSIDQAERFKRMWTRLIPPNYSHSVFFANHDSNENLSF